MGRLKCLRRHRKRLRGDFPGEDAGLSPAEIDGDIVSLYHNNEEVISHKTLGKEVIKYSFKADKQHTYHELVLVAENLGSIPPNTALMRIRAGEKKYELTTRANLQENAKVIIEYTGE